MKKMKSIKWTGEHRIIPGYSVAVRGQVITVPEDMANSYIEQGMAEELKKPKQDRIVKGG